MKIYAVGGSVRDALLGLPVKDRDYVVVGSSAEEMLAQGFRPVGADFPVFLHPSTNEEYALARTERKSGHGYKGFVFHAAPDVTLEQDLARRDLTINAMAQDQAGALIDPHGGARDLEQRVLRHVGPAFAEDPVRILRVARFAARFAGRGFRVAPDTRELMRRMVACGEADHLVPERVWQELARGLMEEQPSTMLDVLADCGALERVAREIPRDEDAWRALDRAARAGGTLEMRFAALMARAGAPEVERLSGSLRVPADCRDLALLAARHHAAIQSPPPGDAAAWLQLLDATDALRRPERFRRLVLVCGWVADRPANTAWEGALRALLATDFGAIAAANVTDVAAAIRSAKLECLQQFHQERTT